MGWFPVFESKTTTTMKRTIIPLVLTILACATISNAQPPRPPHGPPPQGGGGNQGQGGGEQGKPRPGPPLFNVIDQDHDGVLSKKELRKAKEAILTLDKNGDGEITLDEIRPPGPPPQGDDAEEQAEE